MSQQHLEAAYANESHFGASEGHCATCNQTPQIIQEFEEIPYSFVVNVEFKWRVPNKKLRLTGDVAINIFGTSDGDSGKIYIHRTSGSEIIILNGLLKGTLPLGENLGILLTYINADSNLFWYIN